MNDAAALRTQDIGTVDDQFFTLRDFPVADGSVLPNATIAFETNGRLARDGRNAVLVTHGYTGSHHAAGRNPANANQPGSWDGLIGPGKPIDTDKLFVVASNMLGSSFGSTNAASLNPPTGAPYGPDFPAIALSDIVAAQKALLDSLGVRHLVAVAGPSYGGYQAFQWAVAYPDFIDAIVPVNTAPWASVNTDKQLAEMEARLATDPEWHGGRYYGKGGAKTVLTEIRIDTLKRYGTEANLTPRYPDPAERAAARWVPSRSRAARSCASCAVPMIFGLIGWSAVPATDFAAVAGAGASFGASAPVALSAPNRSLSKVMTAFATCCSLGTVTTRS